MLSVKLRLLQQFFLPVLFEASDRICAAGGEVSSHPQMRRVERDILVIVYYASQKVCLGSIWRTVAVCLEGLASALDSQVPESCWGMLERVRIELPGGAGVRSGRRTCLCSPSQQSPQADTHTQNGACRRAGAI